jgi:hypothetical protein
MNQLEAPLPETLAGQPAPSAPEILNTGPPRNGKIAKLPRELRDLLYQMLVNALSVPLPLLVNFVNVSLGSEASLPLWARWPSCGFYV